MQRQIVIRGNEAREAFVRQNELTCIGHLVLLPGKVQTCCCGRKDITSEYFIFSCRNLQKPEEVNVIFAGPGCGRKIAEKANTPVPPIVSIFSKESESSCAAGYGAVNGASRGESFAPIEFSPLNNEMYLALSVLFTEWDEVRPGYLCNCFEFVIKNPKRDVFSSYVRALNRAIHTAVKQYSTEQSFKGLVEQLANNAGKRPRNFSFPLIRGILEKEYPEEFLMF